MWGVEVGITKKAGGINKPLELRNFIFTKNANEIYFLLAPANMLGTSQIPICCMKRQHAVILESITETDSIIISLPTKRTGILTPLLTCFTLFFFSLLLGQIILSPTPFLPSTPLEKNFFISNSSSRFSLDKKIQSQNSLFSLLFLHKKFKVQPQINKIILSPIFLLFFAYPFHTLATGA